MFNKKILLIGSIIIIIIVSISGIQKLTIKPSMTEKDILLETYLEVNDINVHKEYILNLNMDKKEGYVMVYPYIKGLSNIAFGNEGYGRDYISGFVGSDGVTEKIAKEELVSRGIIYIDNNINLVGFSFPNEAGQYKTKIYFDQLESFEEVENPVVICVYKEETLGKIITWSKVIPIVY